MVHTVCACAQSPRRRQDTVATHPYIHDITLKQYKRSGMGQRLTMGFIVHV